MRAENVDVLRSRLFRLKDGAEVLPLLLRVEISQRERVKVEGISGNAKPLLIMKQGHGADHQ
jgi:hypothetical protein